MEHISYEGIGSIRKGTGRILASFYRMPPKDISGHRIKVNGKEIGKIKKSLFSVSSGVDDSLLPTNYFKLNCDTTFNEDFEDAWISVDRFK